MEKMKIKQKEKKQKKSRGKEVEKLQAKCINNKVRSVSIYLFTRSVKRCNGYWGKNLSTETIFAVTLQIMQNYLAELILQNSSLNNINDCPSTAFLFEKFPPFAYAEKVR